MNPAYPYKLVVKLKDGRSKVFLFETEESRAQALKGGMGFGISKRAPLLDVTNVQHRSPPKSPPKKKQRESQATTETAANTGVHFEEGTEFDSHNDVDDDETANLSDNTVFVGNLPPGCSTKEVFNAVTLNMHLLELTDKGGNPVTKCELKGPLAKLQITSSKEAQACILLDGGVELHGQILSFSRVPPCDVVFEGAGASVPVNRHIESDAATEALLHQLILHREEVMTGRIKIRIMSLLLSALQSQRFNFSKELILSRKKYLLKYYRERKKMGDDTWRFYRLLAQLAGDLEFSGRFAELGTNADRVQFDEDATNQLIYEFGQRKDLFDRANNMRQLWDEVAADVNKVCPKVQATWSACERKWASLKSTYLDFKGQLSQSGSDSVVIAWTYYDAMNLVLGNSISVEPEITFAVGAKTVVKKKTKTATPEDSVQDNQSAEPTEVVQYSRRLELEERKIEMQRQFLTLIAQRSLGAGGANLPNNSSHDNSGDESL